MKLYKPVHRDGSSALSQTARVRSYSTIEIVETIRRCSERRFVGRHTCRISVSTEILYGIDERIGSSRVDRRSVQMSRLSLELPGEMPIAQRIISTSIAHSSLLRQAHNYHTNRNQPQITEHQAQHCNSMPLLTCPANLPQSDVAEHNAKRGKNETACESRNRQ